MRNYLNLLVVVFFLITVYSCDNSTEPNLVNDEDNIREIVLRDQFLNNYSAHNNSIQHGDLDSTIKIYFVGLYEEIDSNYFFRGDAIDPETDFLRRFDNFFKKVKKISESEYSQNTFYQIQDKTTEELGLIFKVGPIKWLSENKVEVEAGYLEGRLSAGGLSYILYKENDKWNIHYKIHRWVS